MDFSGNILSEIRETTVLFICFERKIKKTDVPTPLRISIHYRGLDAAPTLMQHPKGADVLARFAAVVNEDFGQTLGF